jgi:cytochrome b561
MIRNAKRFTLLQRCLHWLMAVCILAMLFIGIGMVSTIMPKYAPLLKVHKTLGIAILVLALLRLGVRLRFGAPPLPADLPAPMKLGAHLSHYALYALMIGMPIIGWAMLSAAAYPIVLYGNIQLPPILPQSDALHTLLWDAHALLALAFFALILLHLAAALFHALIRRDGVFESMGPTLFDNRDGAAAGPGIATAAVATDTSDRR